MGRHWPPRTWYTNDTPITETNETSDGGHPATIYLAWLQSTAANQQRIVCSQERHDAN
jgi:hypothetical protein